MFSLIIASAAYAQTNQVLSRNAVGYVKVEMRTNSYYLVRNDFVSLAGPSAVSNVFGLQVPQGTQLIRWNEASQSYLSTLTRGATSWGPGGTNLVSRGDAVWVRIPAFNGTTVTQSLYNVFFMGEVPDALTAPTSTVTFINGYNLVGYPYPVDTLWTNTAIAQSLPGGTTLIMWNATNQSYSANINKSTTPGSQSWGPVGNALTLKPGQGFFINLKTNIIVNAAQAKPYSWP